jgi:hypothetical protein
MVAKYLDIHQYILFRDAAFFDEYSKYKKEMPLRKYL